MFEDAPEIAPLVESHAALVAHLSALEELAHHLRGCPGASAFTNLAESVTGLRSKLEQHMAHEESSIYPSLVAKLGSNEVESMLEDHREIRRWMDKLIRARVRFDRGELDLEPLRWNLYIVIGAVGLHLRKEELAYLRLASKQVELPAG